jgi:two-component system response regulator NreC
MTARILLADDHSIIRQGLRALLEKYPQFEIVGEAENGLMAMNLAEKLKPDIVIMDISMPDLNGIDATRKIIESIPGTRVIALSMHSSRRFVVEMLKAGASAYILKECLFDTLLEAIQTVLKGGIFLGPKIESVVIQDYIKRLSPAYRQEKQSLTSRQREVIQLLAEGKSTKQIALRLHVSPKTIESNRRNIMEKLGINSIAGLTKYAVREGITPIDS